MTDKPNLLDAIAKEVITEYLRARREHNIMHNPHEGISVIREEYDELWDEIKKQNYSTFKLRKEAVQLAAMVLAFINEVCCNKVCCRGASADIRHHVIRSYMVREEEETTIRRRLESL